MNKIRFLFVGGSKRYSAAQKLIESASEFNLQAEIFSYEIGYHHPIGEIATIIQGKKFSDPEAVDHLQEVIKTYAIDIALPFHDASIGILASLSHLVFVPTCDIELVKIFESKRKSSVFFKSHNIPVPRFSSLVPAIAKPDFGSASKGLLKITDQTQLDAFLAGEQRADYEVQDLVSGPEYSVDGYIALNSDFSHFAVRERLEVLGGEATKSVTVEIKDIEAYCNQLTKIAGIRGAITIQFIYDDRNGTYGVMEINPRLGGGMLTSLGAGVPWFKILISDFLKMPQVKIRHKNNILMMRSFREHFFDLNEQ